MNHVALALPFAALLAALPVQAQVSYSSSTSISNIRYTLTDLDLTDGVSPYLVPEHWSNGSAIFEAQYWDHDSGQEEQATRDVKFFDQQTLAFDTVTAGPDSKHLQVAASISGDSLSSLAIANTATVDGSGRGRGGTFSDISLQRVFILSPNTLMSISFDVNTVASHTGLAVPGWANSYAFVRVADQYAHFKHYAEVPEGMSGQEGLQNFNATVESRGREHYVNVDLWVRATSVVKDASPVPEPQTYAMLLAGLGLIGWRRARGGAAR